MAVELACAAPAYLDLTFQGLRSLPRMGTEEFSTDLLRSPGGGALNAIGAARLGLRTGAAFPIGADEAGAFLRAELEREGIDLASTPSGRTALTAVMPVAEDRAMVTYDPETRVDPRALASLGPERVLCTIDQVGLIPLSARAFVTVGDREARRHARRSRTSLPPGATLFVNAVEATALTGRNDLPGAARALAEWATIVVATRGADGAVAYVDNTLVEAPGVRVDVVDTTGAGDLLAAAWVWGNARGLDMESQLRWAVLYAALSVAVPTGAAGAVDLDRLVEEGTSRGLPEPSTAEPAGDAS